MKILLVNKYFNMHGGSETYFFGLADLLRQPKETALSLRPLIGVNLTLPNRVLSQSCLLAGCNGDTSLIPLLMPLLHPPSPAVTTHAAWALSRLQEGISFLSEL